MKAHLQARKPKLSLFTKSKQQVFSHHRIIVCIVAGIFGIFQRFDNRHHPYIGINFEGRSQVDNETSRKHNMQIYQEAKWTQAFASFTKDYYKCMKIMNKDVSMK